MAEALLGNQVKNIVEELIIVSQLKKDDKIKILSGKIQIDPARFLQGFKRQLWSFDNREDTINCLEDLYTRAFTTVDMIRGKIDLHKPTTIGIKFLTSGENEKYLIHKAWLDRLGIWIEKSICGLNILRDTYKGEVPSFFSLAEESLRQVEKIKNLSTSLNDAYKTIKILSPLASNENLEKEYKE